MEITQNIQPSLAKFRGSMATVSHYGRFGAVLTVSIHDGQSKWYVSFSDCRRVTFQTEWSVGAIAVSQEQENRLRIRDTSGGFEIICGNCYLIHEDEYMADDSETSLT